jgi:hypothetical protein
MIEKRHSNNSRVTRDFVFPFSSFHLMDPCAAIDGRSRSYQEAFVSPAIASAENLLLRAGLQEESRTVQIRGAGGG